MVEDQVRDATDMVGVAGALTKLTGAQPILLTGYNPHAAALAAEVVITDVRAGLLPQDKVDAMT